MKKIDREKVYAKCKGHCGYCGQDIEFKKMQVDHMTPACYSSHLIIENSSIIGSTKDDFDNLMPSCRKCNHYKRAMTVDQFRYRILTLHERIQKIYIAEVGVNFGVLIVKPFEGIFYFEIDSSTKPD